MKKFLCWLLGHEWFYKSEHIWALPKCHRCGRDFTWL